MLVVWLISIVVIGIISKFIFNHYHKTERLIRAKVIATVSICCQCVCVYYFCQSLIPYVVRIMDVFYH